MKYKEIILQCWDKGLIDFGSVEEASIRYVTNYVLKKLDHPKELNKPFQLASQGIGLDYAIKNMDQILKNMSIQLGNKEVQIPRYYQKKYGLTTDEKFKKSEEVQKKIYEKLKKLYPEWDDEKLHKEVVKARYQKERNIKAKEKLREDKI